MRKIKGGFGNIQRRSKRRAACFRSFGRDRRKIQKEGPDRKKEGSRAEEKSPKLNIQNKRAKPGAPKKEKPLAFGWKKKEEPSGQVGEKNGKKA